MNKKRVIFAPFILLFASLLVYPIAPIPQEKENAKSQEKEKAKGKATGGVVGGVVRGVVGSGQGGIQSEVPGGVIGGIEYGAFDDDFLLEPRKTVQFKIEHLVIRPADTTPLPETTDLRTEFGRAVNYSYSGSLAPKESLGLEITPFLVEGKGMDLKIAVLHDGQKAKEETLRLRNFEPVIVELFEDKEKQIKLADRITPLIRTVDPLRNYPSTIEKLELVNHVLIMNDKLLCNRSRGGYLSADNASESDPWYLFFSVMGKGVYVLSFWPFEGAEPIGVVSSNAIRIKHHKDYFALISMKPILPEGKWRVWVRNNPSYDPVQDMPPGLSAEERAEMKAALKDSAFPGVTRGRGVLKKFFGK